MKHRWTYHQHCDDTSCLSVLQANRLIKCLEDLNDSLIGTLRRQNELFNFKDKEEIDYLVLHVEYVEVYFVDVCACTRTYIGMCGARCMHITYTVNMP